MVALLSIMRFAKQDLPKTSLRQLGTLRTRPEAPSSRVCFIPIHYRVC